MTVSLRAQDVRSQLPQWMIGQLVYTNPLDRKDALVNDGGQLAQGDTFTISGATDSIDYTVAVEGNDVTINSGVGSTVTSIALALATALSGDPIARGVASYTPASAIITVAGLRAGQAFDISEDDANITYASVTAAAAASNMPIGRFVIDTGFVAAVGTVGGLSAYRSGALPLAANFTAQVDTLTTPYISGTDYLVDITIEGVDYKFSAIGATNIATTVAALAAVINSGMPINTVVATTSGTGIILTAEKPGATFTTKYGLSDGGATNPTLVFSTTKSRTTSLELAAGGVTLRASEVTNLTSGNNDAAYLPNTTVPIVQQGVVSVANTQAPVLGDAVWVETASGANIGKLYNTASATRILLPSAHWERTAQVASSGTAAVRINIAP